MKGTPLPWMTPAALHWRRGVDCIWAAMLRWAVRQKATKQANA